MLCGKCNKDNPADASFCEGCGWKLELICVLVGDSDDSRKLAVALQRAIDQIVVGFVAPGHEVLINGSPQSILATAKLALFRRVRTMWICAE
jgi:hypothetical protein